MDWLDGPTRAAPVTDDDRAGIDLLLAGLNPEQRRAVEHGDGPLLILAGPGSGKTRVVTSRVAYLVRARGVRPGEILAITFTNKAAREMRERVAGLLDDVRGLWVSTFHSMCARLLRSEIEHLRPYTRDFTIYDTSDKNQLLSAIVKELGYDAKRFRPPAIGAWISDLKNRVETPGELRLVPRDGAAGGMDEDVFHAVRRRYLARMEESNALDFDDLLLKVLQVFDEHPGVRDAYAYRFRYVMVDEYQDTNRVQYLLTRHLASAYGNLAVCGDPDQSIYGWRGADIRNIRGFEEDFPNPAIVKLEQNYRSTGHILTAASAVIAHNSGRKPMKLWTAGERGELLRLVECGDENDEAHEIASLARGFVARGGRWSDTAILYRANFMQRALESALRLSGVPYQVLGGLEFYARREIKDLVAWLRLIVNPRDDNAFLRVVNAPSRGVGATSLEKLGAWAAERRVSLLEAAASDEALAQIRGRGRSGLVEFRDTVQRLGAMREVDAGVVLDAVLEELAVERWLAEMDDGTGTADREANVEELRGHAHEYDRLHPDAKVAGFLADVALVSDVDSLEENADSVKLMTLHSCKGLEFGNVFIAGCEEELLPHMRALADDPEAGEEEERRLFYVGMTRARQRLVLTRAGTRRFFGEDRWQRPSRFLEELPSECVEGLAAEEDEEAVLGTYVPPAADTGLVIGDWVSHSSFGRGRVLQLTGAGVNARASVEFPAHGTKLLLLQYANLQRIPGRT